jgi:hypothetical protein
MSRGKVLRKSVVAWNVYLRKMIDLIAGACDVGDFAIE